MSRSGEKVVKVDNGEMRVVSERYNSLVPRLEVEAIVSHQGSPTPSRKTIAEALSKIYSKNPDLIVVRKVETEYGAGASRIYAHIYEDLGRLRSFEPEYILKRQGVGV
ncbi:MAG: hypothetical protein RMI56_03440 [Sulfolobales archaeon]|nr:hypothetical protein [Sulfolobales archaeon]MDW8082834.1 hypothetical protein [Sulfolobales archaeon]